MDSVSGTSTTLKFAKRNPTGGIQMSASARSIFTGLALAATFAIGPALAQTVSLKADLRGANEVPPTASSGTGTLTATYDTASRRLSWQGEVSGLSGAPTAAHFHGPAQQGQNAGIMVPAPGVTNGPFQGSATLTPDQARAITAGQTYFNIHTAANPGGEVRGQVVRTR